jgi:hypothetical protein
MVSLLTDVAAAAAATPAAAAKCVPGCYALAINEEMPRRLQVSSSLTSQGTIAVVTMRSRVGRCKYGHVVLSMSGLELQFAPW